jgi:hypothetical protein
MASNNMLPGCWPVFRNGTFNNEVLRVSIPIEMYNSAGFNLTLDVDGSEARVHSTPPLPHPINALFRSILSSPPLSLPCGHP